AVRKGLRRIDSLWIQSALITWIRFADVCQSTTLDRRARLRMLCADVVEIEWTEKNGRNRRCRANLEDISRSGVGLLIDRPLPLLTIVRIRHERAELVGKVKYCALREIGYLLGVEFERGYRWSQRDFQPRHLLNPLRL